MLPQWFPTLTSPLPSLHYYPYPPAHTLLSCSPFIHLHLTSSSLTRLHLNTCICLSQAYFVPFTILGDWLCIHRVTSSPPHIKWQWDSRLSGTSFFPWALAHTQICTVSSHSYVLSLCFHADHLELKGPVPGGSLLLFTLPGSLLVTTQHLFPPFLSLVCPFLWLLYQSSEIEGHVPCLVSTSPGILPPQTLSDHYSLTTSPALPLSFLVYQNNHFQHNFFLSVHPTLVIYKDILPILYIFSLPLILVLPCIHNDI